MEHFGKFLRARIKKDHSSIGRAAERVGISKTAMARLLKLTEPGALHEDTIAGLRGWVGDDVLRFFPVDDDVEQFSENHKIPFTSNGPRTLSQKKGQIEQARDGEKDDGAMILLQQKYDHLQKAAADLLVACESLREQNEALQRENDALRHTPVDRPPKDS